MNNEEKPKTRKRVRIGVLILAVAIIIILFKVDLRKDIEESPRFQSNIAYIEEKVGNFFQKHIKKPLLSNWDSLLNIKTPVIDQSTIDKKIQPDKIIDYFNVTSQETVDELSSPDSN